jgi:hypothetical protein
MKYTCTERITSSFIQSVISKPTSGHLIKLKDKYIERF